MLMQVGRVVYVNYGPTKGKIAVVVDMVDENRVIFKTFAESNTTIIVGPRNNFVARTFMRQKIQNHTCIVFQPMNLSIDT